MKDNTQPEALRLADELAQRWGENMACPELDAAAELRRLHAENERLAALVEAQQPADCGNTPYDEGPFTLAQQPAPSAAGDVFDEPDEVIKLRALAATCYAGLGAECNLPENWLDALNAAANGEPFTTSGLLPYKAQPSTTPQADSQPAPSGGVVVTDGMVLAALRVQYPAAYGQYLRHPANGPKTSLRTESEIDTARRMIVAALSAATTPPAQPNPLRAALLKCIAVIERTAHCNEADRLAAADEARQALATQAADSVLEDAARWQMLPAFFEEYQIDAMKLYRDIDAAIAARKQGGA